MTTKQHITLYLRQNSGWISGSELESMARDWQTKASVISRRARELANDGEISRQIGERRTVQYKFYQTLNANMANDYLRKLKEQEQGVLFNG